ncbi:MAG: hypothetical protein AABX79_01960 [Nanoarchaeota archaeon]
MQKSVLVLFLVFLVIGMYVNAPIVIAEEGSGGNNSGSGSDSDSNSVTDNSRNSEDDTSSSGSSNNEEEERTETRIRERNGEVESEFRSEIRTAGGERVKIERKIKIKGGEVEIETELEVEGEGSNFSVTDSEGERHRVRVTSDNLRALLIERLNASNITGFSLDEIEHKNIPRVVFKVNSEHPGRFLGIFKLVLKAETQIDPETGEVLDINVPWWIFLVTGDEISDTDEIIGNETIEEDLVADDDELEEEFGDIEIEEELEIKAETQNGTSEVKVELEFDTETTNTDDVISEVLSKLTLTSEEINSFLEMEVSDEPLEDKEKLEFEIDSEDELTEVGFEIKFVLNSNNREEIVNAITERLSALTAENIKNALTLEEDDEDEEGEIEEEENETEEENNETVNETNSSA